MTGEMRQDLAAMRADVIEVVTRQAGPLVPGRKAALSVLLLGGLLALAGLALFTFCMKTAPKKRILELPGGDTDVDRSDEGVDAGEAVG